MRTNEYIILEPIKKNEFEYICNGIDKRESVHKVGSTTWYSLSFSDIVVDVHYIYKDKRVLYKRFIEQHDISITELSKSVEITRQMLNLVLLSKRSLQKDVEERIDSYLGFTSGIIG